MSALSFEHVSVRFGRGARTVEAVRDVSFTVPSGRIVGLVGESGSGKSTLARAAVGLHEPSSGTITLDGVDVANARGSVARRRQTIQMVFQDPNSCLDPQMTVGESIAEALVIAARRQHRETSAAGPTTKASRRDRTAELLTKVNLHPDHAHVCPNKLSGGQRQRVAIARALAAEPHVLLADEITSALDVSVQGSVLNVLLDLHAELGLTILFISHNLAVVRQLCDDVVVLNQGELVEQGPVLDVLDNPAQDYTRELLGAIPRLGQPLFPERSPRDDSPAAG